MKINSVSSVDSTKRKISAEIGLRLKITTMTLSYNQNQLIAKCKPNNDLGREIVHRELKIFSLDWSGRIIAFNFQSWGLNMEKNLSFLQKF